jgi:hypothetical protein
LDREQFELPNASLVSRTHFHMEFELYFVELTFIPKVHKGVQMGFKGINELSALGASRTNWHLVGSKTKSLVGFGVSN